MPQERAKYLRWSPHAALALAIGILVYLFIYVWRRTYHDYYLGDFWHFYTAAKALDHGVNPYSVTAPGFSRPGYIYPPLVAFLYWPLAHFFAIGAAARIALVVNVAAVAVAFWVGARTMLRRFGENMHAANAWAPTIFVALGAMVLTLDKIKGELQMLQTNALILAALLLALAFLDRLPIFAGVALGFAMNIKYQSLVILPYLLIRRRWKAAGSMAVSTVLWGFLPAVLVGFSTELRYLGMAFGGLLRLVGINPGTTIIADIEGIRAGFSVSITSAAARWLTAHGSSASPFLLAGAIGILWIVVLALIYHARGAAWIRWPAARAQASQPFTRWVAVEWMILVATTLCFSPQTNTRHLVLAAVLNLAALAILVTERGRRFRWSVLVAIFVLWAGLNLPFGHRTKLPAEQTTASAPGTIPYKVTEQDPAVERWHYIGGPSWMMLIAAGLITWAGLGRRAGDEAAGEADLGQHVK